MGKLVAAAAALFAMSLNGLADTVVLRDGTTHQGRVVAATNSTITFQTDKGQTQTFYMKDVERLQFEPVQQGQSAAQSQNQNPTIPANTSIVVRNDAAIDTSAGATAGRTYPATVAQSIVGEAGNVIVPAGSPAQLIISQVDRGGTFGTSELMLDLQSITLNGQPYVVRTGPAVQKGSEGLGANKRTATHVGGGTAIGTVIGAIAGGGKGAAIGAGVGAAAGAGTQILTRGKEVKVPAETQLTFKTSGPVQLVPQQR
jgi:hypothetical protein